MREEVLNSILSELNGTSADIEASAIISFKENPGADL